MTRLTESQLQAVNTLGSNVLVSASAGTGKTHAMINRVIDIVLGRKRYIDNGIIVFDENLNKRVPVNRILLMTFTNAAAAEMKQRLFDALVTELNKLSADDKEKQRYLIEQIDMLPMCDISTIHAFSAKILRKYFQEAGISQLFDIAAESEEEGYIKEALKKSFDELEEDEGLSNLREIFALMLKDDTLEGIIVKIYKFAYSLQDYDKWIEDTAVSQYGDDVKSADFINLYLDNINKRAEKLTDYLSGSRAELLALDQRAYVDWLDSAIDAISKFIKVRTFEGLKPLIAARVMPEYAPSVNRSAVILRNSIKKKIKSFYDDNSLTSDYINDGIRDDIRLLREFVTNVLKIVKLFGNNLNKIKEKNNKLGFGDIERVMAKLMSDDNISDEIKSCYDYVLIDEYQDINYLQEYIITRISQGDNLFMVGDSKQSIYRFRQAVPEIFVGKERLFGGRGGGVNIKFNENFRSRKAILDYVNSVFSKAMTTEFGQVDYLNTSMLKRLDDDDTPYRVNSFPAVSLYTYKDIPKELNETDDKLYSVKEHTVDDDETTNAQFEAGIIYKVINDLLNTPYYDEKSRGVKKINYSDIALIFRSRTHAANVIVDELIKRGLPLNTATFIKEDTPDEIRLLINLLKLIDNGRQDIPLIAVMRSYFGKFTDEEIVSIGKAGNKFYYELLPKAKGKIGLKVKQFLAFIEKYRNKAAYMTVFELIEEIIEETGYDRYILAHKDGESKYRSIIAYLDSVKDNNYRTLNRFLSYSDTHNNSFKASYSITDMITVSTMHGVKGLEYPVVIFASVDTPFNYGKGAEFVTDNELGLAFKSYDIQKRVKRENLIYKVLRDRQIHKEKEDNLNLLYVTLTRAKNHLIITGKENKDGIECPETPEDAKNFLSLIAFGLNRMHYETISYNELMKETAATDDIAYFSDKVDPIYYEQINRVLSHKYLHPESVSTGIKYTVTAINKSIESGDAYIKSLFEEDSALKGSIAHKLMQHIDLKCSDISGLESEISRLVEEQLLLKEDADDIDRGEILKCLNSPVIKYARTNRVLREREFILKVRADEILNNGCDDEVLLQGTVDLIILGDKNIIVDYKRSGYDDIEKIKKKYSSQLKLYTMAVERIMNIRVDRRVIYLFGKDIEIEV
ncbi:MAG: UvrD-helicase domain-containing protein [Christensenellales bacterium]|jgi:ATP-dependent helicase/nuclease subunit A